MDNALILQALQRQADVVRLTPVMLPNGTFSKPRFASARTRDPRALV